MANTWDSSADAAGGDVDSWVGSVAAATHGNGDGSATPMREISTYSSTPRKDFKKIVTLADLTKDGLTAFPFEMDEEEHTYTAADEEAAVKDKIGDNAVVSTNGDTSKDLADAAAVNGGTTGAHSNPTEGQGTFGWEFPVRAAQKTPSAKTPPTSTMQIAGDASSSPETEIITQRPLKAPVTQNAGLKEQTVEKLPVKTETLAPKSEKPASKSASAKSFFSGRTPQGEPGEPWRTRASQKLQDALSGKTTRPVIESASAGKDELKPVSDEMVPLKKTKSPTEDDLVRARYVLYSQSILLRDYLNTLPPGKRSEPIIDTLKNLVDGYFQSLKMRGH